MKNVVLIDYWGFTIDAGTISVSIERRPYSIEVPFIPSKFVASDLNTGSAPVISVDTRVFTFDYYDILRDSFVYKERVPPRSVNS